MNNKKRYEVYLTVENYPYRGTTYKLLTMQLFKDAFSEADKKEIPNVIKEYDPVSMANDRCAWSIIADLFTEEEIFQLKPYFSLWGTLETVEVPLPIEADYVGVSGTPTGGPQGAYAFCEHEDYPIKFKIWGFYDVRYCE